MKSKKYVRNTNKSRKFRKINGGDDSDFDYDTDDDDGRLEAYCRRIGSDKSAIHNASYEGCIDIVKIILDKDETVVDEKDDSGNTPLNYACMNGQIKIIKLLLAKGANVNNSGYLGMTPLHHLFQDGFQSKIRVDIKKVQKFGQYAKILLEQGADVTAKDRFGYTPLHVHCRRIHGGTQYIIKALLEYGADVNARTNENDTPLHINCYYITQKDEVGVAELLIEKGADMTAVNIHNRIPLDNITNQEARNWMSEKIKIRNDANARVLNSKKASYGENKSTLLPSVILDNISRFGRMELSRPLDTEQIKRSQDKRTIRNQIEGLKALNEKKTQGILLPHEILRNIREFDGTIDDKKIATERDDQKQIDGAKYFGGKCKTKRRRNQTRKTKKNKTRKH